MLTRRYFIKSSAVAMAGFGVAPAWLARAAAPAEGKRKILISIFQRGAADGLNIVVPFFEKRYYDIRPTIAVPVPGRSNGAIDLDGRFALHPTLQALKPFWDNGQLAIIHAAGSPDGNRSHFEAQDHMESGTPGRTMEDGWLNRALDSNPSMSPLRAVAMGPKMPRTLRGNRNAIAVGDLQQFQARDQGVASILESMYTSTADKQLMTQGKGTFDAMKLIESINRTPYTPANGAVYVGEFGNALRQIARLIKAEAGLEAAFAEIGGWDHHANENGQLPGLLNQYGNSLAAFARDMGDRMQDIVLVTMSEFGRTAAESGNYGTDHGHGNVMFVLGGPVNGGKIFGSWPGLQPEQLFERRDLEVTTDFRAVLSELVRDHIGRSPEQVFPGYKPGDPLGLLKA
ncbi:MAG TPA: DUF1501 domain-containing protein, partial [Terriglobia bacterium]|nr:DUF1501 domain-containing protein [Terriglobia bacterium]